MDLTNRLVRSTTWEGMCEPDWRPTDYLTKCYANLPQGGVDLIISGYTFIRPDGQGLPGQMVIFKKDSMEIHGDGNGKGDLL